MATATAPKRPRKKATMTLGERIIQSLKDIAADARGEDAGVLRYMVPHGATPEQVGAIRRAAERELRAKERKKRQAAGAEVAKSRTALGVSVEEFAELLGVRAARVKAWEAGTKAPTGSDRLLLADIAARPKYWRKRLLPAA